MNVRLHVLDICMLLVMHQINLGNGQKEFECCDFRGKPNSRGPYRTASGPLCSNEKPQKDSTVPV